MDTDPSYDMTLLSERWADVHGSTEAASLEQELARELSDEHRLFGVPARAVAVRGLPKEVIFWLPADNTWAWVHLTWTDEAGPLWPSTEIVANWQDTVGDVRDAARE